VTPERCIGIAATIIVALASLQVVSAWTYPPTLRQMTEELR
jgi:hypothetical protein